jgi:FtsP/CotA-like multicopper oxidase with cupredoxin domain
MDYERLTRRNALQRGFAGVGGLAFVCSFNHRELKSVKAKRTSAYVRSAASTPFDPFQVDLPQPRVIRPAVKGDDLDKYAITVKPGTAEILPGYDTPILGYDGSYPGPTFRVKRDKTAQVTFTNQAQRDLVVHLHGGVTPPDSDGYPADIFANGTSKTYTYTNVGNSALLWYHDHSHGETARTLYAGLAGMYVLEDPNDEQLGLPSGDYDVPLMIQDRSFNSDGSLRYRVDLDRGFHGDTILVNGAVAPRMKVERRLYRFRILNASNARGYTLALGNNRPMTQIGTDAGLLPEPVTRRQISLEPAERVDVVIDFRKFGRGSKITLHNLDGEPSTTAVMRFDVVRGGAEEAHVPDVLGEYEELPPVNAQREWALTFQGLGLAQWQISGAGFDYNRIDCRPRQGSSELWQFTNYSNRVHPMHLHLAHFRVISIDGAAPDAVQARGMKDTVRVGPYQKVVIRPFFDYYSGLYVFHCHASEHGDMSMMGQMEVVA